MSNIYILHFPEQKAIKIGKADNLQERLSDLVKIWGPIDNKCAYAIPVDPLIVINYEKQIHEKFSKFKLTMPYGDGYQEFFKTDVLKHLDYSKLIPISKTAISKINKHKQQKQINRVHKINIKLTSDEFEFLLNKYNLSAHEITDHIRKSLLNEQKLEQNSDYLHLKKLYQQQTKEKNRLSQNLYNQYKRQDKQAKQFNQTIYNLKQNSNIAMFNEIEALKSENKKLTNDLQRVREQRNRLEIKMGHVKQLFSEIRRISKGLSTQINKQKMPKPLHKLNDRLIAIKDEY